MTQKLNSVRRKNLIRQNVIMKTLFDKGPLSLAELKNHTGISIPVVTSLVNQLKQADLIEEMNHVQPNQAGRPPSVIRLKGDAGYFLGIDIGRVNTSIVLLDLAQNVILSERKQSLKLCNDSSILDEMQTEVERNLHEAKIPREKIIAIGISIPGFVQGPVGKSETYFDFGEEPLDKVLSRKFNQPVYIEHDAKAMALGEMWFGAAKNRRNVLCINLGWGLGLGIIIEGKLYYGSSYYAGEFGHLQVNPEGHLCYCGKRGCLETYASGRALASIAKERIRNGAQTNLLRNSDITVDQIDAIHIIQAATAGDQFSIEIIEEAARYLGYGTAQLINLFNPELIIIGGGITEAIPYVVNYFISNAMKFSMTQLNKHVKFELSNLGHMAGALGVAVHVARKSFETEHSNSFFFKQ